MLNFNFDDNVNRFLKIIAKSASVQNIRVFFVGGAVRDNFLNIDVKDVDILISPTCPTTAFDIGSRNEDPLAMYLTDIATISNDFFIIKIY